MAWGKSNGAISVYVEGAYKGYANKTSTATLYLPDESGGGKLRMWDISAGSVQSFFRALEPALDFVPEIFEEEPQTSLTASRDEIPIWQCYLDSNADFQFSIDTDQWADRILIQTGVPAERRQFWTRFQRITSYSAGVGPGGSADTIPTRALFRVIYKDPCVIAVPEAAGGGYLMILVRYRTREEDATLPNGTLEQPDVGTCISDIVCYWSVDATFRGTYGTTLKGPFLLVDSLDALDDPYLYEEGEARTKVSFRPWLGVPGAVFVGNDLYLYYVVTPPYPTKGGAKDGAPYLDEERGLEEEVGSFNDGEGLTQVLAFRVISHAEYTVGIRMGLADTDEENWTTASAIPSGPSLPVRAWMAITGAPNRVESFLQKVTQAATRQGSVRPLPTDESYAAKLVDPLPFTCQDQLGLFVAVHANSPFHLRNDPDMAWDRFGLLIGGDADPSLYGLWRLRAVDPATIPRLVRAGVPFAPELGRDFVVSGNLSRRGYPDQVAASFAGSVDEDEEQEPADDIFDYLDPDVVFIPPLGVWRVYTCRDFELVYYSASDLRMCAPAEDAWAYTLAEVLEMESERLEELRDAGPP
jgi:hypothetical protein